MRLDADEMLAPLHDAELDFIRGVRIWGVKQGNKTEFISRHSVFEFLASQSPAILLLRLLGAISNLCTQPRLQRGFCTECRLPQQLGKIRDEIQSGRASGSAYLPETKRCAPRIAMPRAPCVYLQRRLLRRFCARTECRCGAGMDLQPAAPPAPLWQQRRADPESPTESLSRILGRLRDMG